MSKLSILAALLVSLSTTAALAQNAIVYVPETGNNEATAVDPLGMPAPDENTPIDMTGQDGTLRACYGHGGVVVQRDDLRNYCSYSAQTHEEYMSGFVLAPEIDTGYDGVVDPSQDTHILDCVTVRGGTPVQLPEGTWACAL